MIQNSFILLRGVAEEKERQLWQQGILDWDRFVSSRFIRGFSWKKKSFYDFQLRKAKKELYELNSAYFTKVLPRAESWRLYDFFKEDAVSL